jgi:prepilin-type N-terminal cleavage/methylation domain-containing protein
LNPSKSHSKTAASREGFTLLELIVAMVVLVIAMTIAFQAFSGTIRGWRRGTEVMEGLKHGEFAMDQLAQAVRSTIYFYNPRKNYAFLIEKESKGAYPADILNFVTASPAFMPESSPLKYGPHRIKLYIDTDDRGNPALFSLAFPALANPEKLEEEYDDAEPHLVSRAVQGLEVLLYEEEKEDWTTDEWEEENSVPERIKLIVYVGSEDKNEDPIVFEQIIEIPVAESVKLKIESPTSSKNNKRKSRPGGKIIAPGGNRPPVHNIAPGGARPPQSMPSPR